MGSRSRPGEVETRSASSSGASRRCPGRTPPATPDRRERWIREVSTVAARRDLWYITGQSTLDKQCDVSSRDQMGQR